MSLSFDEWLRRGMQNGARFAGPSYNCAEDEIPRERLAEYFIELNRQIGGLGDDFSDDQLANAIFYFYGNSGHLSTVSTLQPGSLVQELFGSIRLLYRDLFEVRCSNFYSHINCGPDSPGALNAPCYMLWDMDLGVSSFWLSGDREHVGACIDLLKHLSTSVHIATIESAIHGLGEMVADFRLECQPILEQILDRRDLTAELRTYALGAAYLVIE